MRAKRILKTAVHLLSSVCFACLFLLAALLLIARMTGGYAYVILSGSMEPSIPVGALILVRPVGNEGIREGDPITFTRGDVIVTHRVAAVTKDGFVTKGDQNELPDAGLVTAENLIGMPTYVIPWMGYLVHAIRRPAGIILAALPALLGVLSNLFDGPAEEQKNKDTRSQNKSL